MYFLYKPLYVRELTIVGSCVPWVKDLTLGLKSHFWVIERETERERGRDPIYVNKEAN